MIPVVCSHEERRQPTRSKLSAGSRRKGLSCRFSYEIWVSSCSLRSRRPSLISCVFHGCCAWKDGGRDGPKRRWCSWHWIDVESTCASSIGLVGKRFVYLWSASMNSHCSCAFHGSFVRGTGKRDRPKKQWSSWHATGADSIFVVSIPTQTTFAP
jgi:hypothetical protein